MEWQAEELTAPRRRPVAQLGLGALRRVDAEPRSLAAILDRGLEAFRNHLGIVVLAGMIAFVPATLSALVGTSIQAASEELLSWTVFWSGLASVWIAAMCARAMSYSIVGRRVSWREIVHFKLGEALGLLVLSALVAGLLFVSVFTLIGWIFVGWLLALAPSVYVLEPAPSAWRHVQYALRRSVQLARDGFWRWAGIAIVAGVIQAFGSSLDLVFIDPENWVRAARALHLTVDQVEVLYSLLVLLPKTFVTAISAFVMASFYFDQRALLECVDLYIAVEELEEA